MPLHIELLTNMRTRRRWSTEQKQQIVLDLVRSGLSLERFARQHGLTPSVLHRWRGNLIEESKRLQGTPFETPAFASVTVAEESPVTTPPATTLGRAEIILRNGRRVIVDADIAPAMLQRLIRALEMPS